MTQQINRRTVTKGIAWSVPAVAIASAAPAFAQSGATPSGELTDAFKYPGQSCGGAAQAFFFGFELKVTNTSDVGVWLYSAGATATVGSYEFANQGANESVYLAPGATQTYIFLMQTSNSGNESGDATISVKWGHTENPDDESHVHAPMQVTGSIKKFSPSQACDQALGGIGARAAAAGLAAEEPVVEEPVVEEPVVEEPVAEEPVAEEPVAEEPVAEEPVAEEPVVEEPVAEETSEEVTN